MATATAPNFCGGCGTAFSEHSRFCAACGSPRGAAPTSPSAPSPQPHLAHAPSVTETRKWFRREPFPIVFGVGSFGAFYAITALPAERIRMPVILMPLYYGLGHEAFFGIMSAILGAMIWAGIKFVD